MENKTAKQFLEDEFKKEVSYIGNTAMKYTLLAMEKYAKQTWDEACKAQMNAVYEHCQHLPQGTNGHAIKHWVNLIEYKKTID